MIYRRLLLALIVLSLASFCIPMPVSAANQPGAVVQLPSVAQLAASDYSNTPQVQLSGYRTANDGGEGTLVLKTCTPDGGSCFPDGATPTPHTYARTNINGDARQFGITAGSVYDVTANPLTATDAEPVLVKAFAAATAAGLNTVHLSQVSVYIAETLELGDYNRLTCDISSIGPYDNGHYYGRPGTIVEAHGATIHAEGNVDQEVISGCVIIPQWYINPAVVSQFGGYTFNSPPQNFDDLDAIRGNMIKAADTAVFFEKVRSGTLQTLGIYCFDNAIHTLSPNETTIDNIHTDSNVAWFTEGGGSSTSVSGIHSQNYCTKQVDDLSGHQISVVDSWSVVSIAASPTVGPWGTHLCRLVINNGLDGKGTPVPTSAVISSTLDDQGNPIRYPGWVANLNVAGVANGQGCKGDGAWAVNVISSTSTTVTLDLLNSQYGTGADKIQATASWTSGASNCIPQPCSIINISVGDMNSIQTGEIIAGTNIPVGSKVIGPILAAKGDDPYDGYIGAVVIDHAVTGNGTDAAITFDGAAYVEQGECGADQDNACIFFDASQRAFAGNSSAGNFTALMPLSNGRRFAADYACKDTVGVKGSKLQSFAHHYNIAVVNCNGISAVQQGSDDANKADDQYDTVGIYMTGSTNKGTFSGSLSGSGTGSIIDLATVSESNSNRTTVSAGSGTGLITLTTAGSVAGWPVDASGHLTVALCSTLDTNNKCTDGDVGTEYATADITGANTIVLLARGEFETAPLSIATTWNIVQASVGSTSGVINMGPGGLNVAGDGLLDFAVLHGSLAMTNIIVRGGSKLGFVSNNVQQSVFTGNLFKDMTIYYPGALAFNTSRGCGNQWGASYTWECMGDDPVGTGIVIDGTAHSVECDATAGNRTITVNAGSLLPNFNATVTKIDTTSNLCIITMSGADTIGGAASAALAALNDALSFKNVNGSTAWIFQ